MSSLAISLASSAAVYTHGGGNRGGELGGAGGGSGMHTLLNTYNAAGISTDLEMDFTKKNKFYVKLIRNYGLFGIAIFSPVLISIPVGSFLAARFFENQKTMALAIMCVAVLIWSVSISTFLFLL